MLAEAAPQRPASNDQHGRPRRGRWRAAAPPELVERALDIAVEARADPPATDPTTATPPPRRPRRSSAAASPQAIDVALRDQRAPPRPEPAAAIEVIESGRGGAPASPRATDRRAARQRSPRHRHRRPSPRGAGDVAPVAINDKGLPGRHRTIANRGRAQNPRGAGSRGGSQPRCRSRRAREAAQGHTGQRLVEPSRRSDQRQRRRPTRACSRTRRRRRATSRGSSAGPIGGRRHRRRIDSFLVGRALTRGRGPPLGRAVCYSPTRLGSREMFGTRPRHPVARRWARRGARTRAALLVWRALSGGRLPGGVVFGGGEARSRGEWLATVPSCAERPLGRRRRSRTSRPRAAASADAESSSPCGRRRGPARLAPSGQLHGRRGSTAATSATASAPSTVASAATRAARDSPRAPRASPCRRSRWRAPPPSPHGPRRLPAVRLGQS